VPIRGKPALLAWARMATSEKSSGATRSRTGKTGRVRAADGALRRAGVVVQTKANLENANAAASCCRILVGHRVIMVWPT
jgi:hypothetical protein